MVYSLQAVFAKLENITWHPYRVDTETVYRCTGGP